MLKLWKSHELRDEADMVYKMYNGGDFIDVGAYSGFYSFLLSTKADDNDNFISCEPDSVIHSELFDNLSVLKKIFNNINYSVITHPINNGKEVAIAHDDWGHPCFQDTSQIDEKNKKISKKFRSTTIDNLVSSLSLEPKFIKIDTEGAEFDILKGMQETLKKFKPKIMLEKHPTMLPKDISIESVNKMLIDHKYKANLVNKNNLAIREVWE
tara:strand:- start:3340 stop:3972 length:633 start_codon:yes stop_codon:yes gene_type:complete